MRLDGSAADVVLAVDTDGHYLVCVKRKRVYVNDLTTHREYNYRLFASDSPNSATTGLLIQLNARRKLLPSSPAAGLERVLCIGIASGHLLLFDCSSMRCLVKLVDHRKAISALAFEPLRNRIASTSLDETIKIWELDDDGNMSTTLRHEPKRVVLSASWSSDGALLATGGTSGVIYLWNAQVARDYPLLRRIGGHRNFCTGLCRCDFGPSDAK